MVIATVVRVLYNILLPVFVVVAAPGWILRMARRGGLGPRLWERLGCYDRPVEYEPAGGIYVHAVSVGEVMIALRLISKVLEANPRERFVLAATTSTGFEVAQAKAPAGVRVIYSPVDLPGLIGRLFRRYEPRVAVLVESELWPNLLRGAAQRGIPVVLANARLSPRSGRRYARFKVVSGPMLGQLDRVCAQAGEHAAAWKAIGVREEAVTVTGSVKFDLDGAPPPARRAEFEAMLHRFGAGRPVVLAASTHPGEEELIARAVREIPGALAVLLPRHAERRGEVAADLERAGFEVVLRSGMQAPADPAGAVFVVDTTGELRDWTPHADVVVIGKSFLARGGQNPVEAIAAGVPVICGPHMENFEPLIGQLREAGAVCTVNRPGELGGALRSLLGNVRERAEMARKATRILASHRGATERTVKVLEEVASRGGGAAGEDRASS